MPFKQAKWGEKNLKIVRDNYVPIHVADSGIVEEDILVRPGITSPRTALFQTGRGRRQTSFTILTNIETFHEIENDFATATIRLFEGIEDESMSGVIINFEPQLYLFNTFIFVNLTIIEASHDEIIPWEDAQEEDPSDTPYELIDVPEGDPIITEVPNGWEPIYSFEDLQKLEDDKNGNFILMANIDAAITHEAGFNNGLGWEPIGTQEEPFQGNINGNGLGVYNLYINNPTETNVGFIGCGENVNIEDLDILNANCLNQNAGFSERTGGLIARLLNSTIKNCDITGNINGNVGAGGVVGTTEDCIFERVNFSGDVAGSQNVGGLVGYYIDGTIEKCFANAKTKGRMRVGGLIGQFQGESVKFCVSKGEVATPEGEHSTVEHLGGFFGECRNPNVKDCYTKADINVVDAESVGGFCGSVTGVPSLDFIERCFASNVVNASGESKNVGGFIGLIDSNRYDFKNCYAVCFITGNNYVGGFTGNDDEPAEYINCFAVSTILPSDEPVHAFTNDADGNSYGLFYDSDETSQTDEHADGKTTAQMKSQATFTTYDFQEVWDIDEGESYPYLRSLENIFEE